MASASSAFCFAALGAVPEGRLEESPMTSRSFAALFAGSRCLVVWEDTRNGNSDVFVASRLVP
jgi:hypothetical protein